MKVFNRYDIELDINKNFIIYILLVLEFYY